MASISPRKKKEAQTDEVHSSLDFDLKAPKTHFPNQLVVSAIKSDTNTEFLQDFVFENMIYSHFFSPSKQLETNNI